jgi:hypothetical protein
VKSSPSFGIRGLAMLTLERAGNHKVCGFRDNVSDRLVFPPITPHSAALQVSVTAGNSCYDIPAGLKINQNQRLIDFYKEYLRVIRKVEPHTAPTIQQHQSELILYDRIRRNYGYISFKKTLRIPEDEKSYPLPAYFDNFPLCKVSNFVEKFPEAMRKNGGLFFSTFQREALALSFEKPIIGLEARRDDLFAMKIYAGSVNCVSGKGASASLAHNEQHDYIVCPRQIRLDGFRSAAGEVKQFIAMPLGWGTQPRFLIAYKTKSLGTELYFMYRSL